MNLLEQLDVHGGTSSDTYSGTEVEGGLAGVERANDGDEGSFDLDLGGDEGDIADRCGLSLSAEVQASGEATGEREDDEVRG